MRIGMAARVSETDIFEEIATQIHRNFNKLLSRVKSRRDKLLAELQRMKLYFDKKNKAQNENLRELEEMRLQIEQLAIKQNFALTVQKSSLDEIDLKMETLKANSFLKPNIKFSCIITDISNQLSTVGTLVDRTGTDTPVSTRITASVPIQVIGKKGKEKGAFDCPQKLHIDTHTKLMYVADYYNNRIQIFNTEDWSYLLHFETDKLVYPNSVATNREYCYVTSYSSNAILQFSQAGLNLIKTVYKTGGSFQKMDGPSHIAISPDNEVFVADWSNNRVCVFDTELFYLREIGANLLKVPKHIVFRDDLTYVLDDNELNCLHAFNKEGSLVRSLLPKGESKLVKTPTSFCFDLKGDLVLADYGSDSIKVVSGDRVVNMGLGTDGNNGYFCVALCGDKLVVSCRELNCIKIFK